MTDYLDQLVERLASTSDARERNQLALVGIPEEMFLERGLREYVTPSGLRVVIEESVEISVEAEKRATLHAWLREHGYAEELSALTTRAATQNKQARGKAESAVLKPLALRLLEAGAPIDLDLMGVSRVVKARLSRDSADLARADGLKSDCSPE
jgi:hypothetical protein